LYTILTSRYSRYQVIQHKTPTSIAYGFQLCMQRCRRPLLRGCNLGGADTCCMPAAQQAQLTVCMTKCQQIAAGTGDSSTAGQQHLYV
jgi:hypothetical protein